MGRQRSRSEWKKLISEFESSEKNQATWCNEKKIKRSTFSTWYNKMKNESDLETQNKNWIPIKLDQDVENDNTSLINIKLGNAVIEVDSKFNEKHLLKILKVLNSIC